MNDAPKIFRAFDGTEFTDRAALRAYQQENAWRFEFRNLEGRTEGKTSGDIGGQQFALSSLRDCTIILCDEMSQVDANDIDDCKLFLGPTSGCVYLNNCSDSEVTVLCSQLRLRGCRRLKVYAHTQSEVSIEDSDDVAIGPCTAQYPEMVEHMLSANLDPEVNHWQEVFDFNDPEVRAARGPAAEAARLPLTSRPSFLFFNPSARRRSARRLVARASAS